MSRVDELLGHARARVHGVDPPHKFNPAIEQRRLQKQMVLVVATCSLVLVGLGASADDGQSLSIPPSLANHQMLALLEAEQGK